jgi:GntR family transcriptional regulator
MDLRIDSKSHVPVHVQLEEQIKHLILSGEFGIGDRLPSIRALAGYLRVNRNTVNRVFSNLEREGFVQSRRGSGVYVLEPPVDEAARVRQRVLERVMDLAREEGVVVEDLAYALLARAGIPSPGKRARIPVLFVECTPSELARYAVELEDALPVDVESVLVDELEAEVAGREELPWRLAVTTFYHVQEVEQIMGPRGIETFALLTEATLDGLRKLAELPRETRVGVIGSSSTCTENLLRSLEGAGLDHLDLFLIQEDAENQTIREDTQVVVCGSAVAQMLPKMGLPKGVEVIVQDRTLSKGGVQMLGRAIEEMRSQDA